MNSSKNLNSFQSVREKMKRKPTKFAFLPGILSGMILFWIGEEGLTHLKQKIQLHSENGKSLYSLGHLYAQQIESTGPTTKLTSSEAQLITLGFQDWAVRRLERVNFDSHRSQLQTFLESWHETKIQRTQSDGQKYLQDYVKSGGLRSLSGLAYRVIIPGSSKKPSLKDWIEVKYQGHLTNGKAIDESGSTGKSVKLPMNGIIPGWTEGLQLIGEGGEIELVVPPHLAYGDEGSSTDIPPGATLVFRIQLVHVIDSGKRGA